MKRGCLIAIVLLACLPLALCKAYNYHAARSVLPRELEIAEVLVYDEQAGLGEGCVYAVYRLTPQGIANIPHAGLAEETPAGLGITNKNYGNLSDGTHLYAMGAANGCHGGRADTPSVGEALAKPGSRFEVINRGEGLIVADPKRGLAWYLYFG